MALRLTSNLLYGVALIYKQKTDYLNNDASSIRTKLQRDLFNVNNNGNRDLLIKQPNYIIKPTELSQISHSGKSSNSSNNQLLLNDDPLFNVNEGLLPSLDDLDFLGPGFIVGNGGTGTQLINTNNRKSQIRRADLENNTISVILSTITNSTEEGDVFTRHHAINDDDQIMDAGNPEFAFDEEGMLLSLHDDETTGQGPTGLGTSVRAISTPLREEHGADFDFDFDFGVDMDRVEGPVTPGITPLSAHEGNELDQILEEIDENSHAVGKGNASTPSIAPQRKKRKINNSAHFIEIVMDDNISLQTNDLRSFRDNYVEAMESQRKARKPQSITIQDLLTETNGLLPNFGSRKTALYEGRRGRSHEREEPEGDEDFVDGLLRNTRRSSESIEVRRNASSTRRNSRRASMSSIHLPLDNDNPRDETTGGDFDLDFDFDFGNIHDFEEQQHSGNSDSRKRSSSIQMFAALEEDQVHRFHDENIETREIEKKTMKFLTFIETRFDEDDADERNFEELMKQNNDAILNKAVIVKSFYEVLQLATLDSLKIIKDEGIDKFKLLSGSEFLIRLK